MTITALLTIFGMALVTYFTRVAGFLLLRKRRMNPRTRQVLDVAPGCVLISVIAPHFVSNNPAELIALAIVLVASIKLPMLVTLTVGVASLAVLNLALGG